MSGCTREPLRTALPDPPRICTLQGPTVDDSRAFPEITFGGFHKDIGVWLPKPFRTDARSPGADVFRRGHFREHGLSSTGEQHFELLGLRFSLLPFRRVTALPVLRASSR